MRHSLLTPLLCAGLLSGCGDTGTVEAQNASAEEVAAKVRAAGADNQFLNPGRWEQTATVIDVDFPGAPPETIATMRNATARAQSHISCLTEEQARNPSEDFFAGVGKNCRYDNFKWGGGRVDIDMRCTEREMVRTMDLAGTYSPNAYQMEMTAKAGVGEDAEGGMVMRMRVDAKRVGECKGDEGA
jgi:hypothetical protein